LELYMKAKKLFAVTALTVILSIFTVLLMTACGGDDSSDNGKNNNTQNQTDGNDTQNQTEGDGVWTAVTDSNLGVIPIFSVAFGSFNGAGKFVIQGNINAMSTSADGVTWNSVTDSAIPNIDAICCGNGIILAGGIQGNMIKSTNGGATWINVSSNFKSAGGAVDIKEIAYGNGKFVVVIGGGKTVTSTDGSTWTSPTDGQLLNAVTFANGKFFAGGANGKIATSTDGIAWETVNVGNAFNYTTSSGGTWKASIYAITYGGGKYVAGGTEGKIAYSIDGVTWTDANVGNIFDYTSYGSNLKAEIHTIAYGNGKYFAGGVSGKMAVSTDGITWTAVDVSGIFGTDGSSSIVQSIAFGNNKFVAVGQNGIGINTGRIARF